MLPEPSVSIFLNLTPGPFPEAFAEAHWEGVTRVAVLRFDAEPCPVQSFS
jgi:hypothetical protein